MKNEKVAKGHIIGHTGPCLEAADMITTMSAGDFAARILFSICALNKKVASIAIYFFLAAEYGMFIIMFCYFAIPGPKTFALAYPIQMTAR